MSSGKTAEASRQPSPRKEINGNANVDLASQPLRSDLGHDPVAQSHCSDLGHDPVVQSHRSDLGHNPVPQSHRSDLAGASQSLHCDLDRDLDHEASERDRKDHTPVPPDGGWGWVVCATATLTSGTVTGFLNVMSIFYAAILNHFGGGAFETAGVSTILVLMTYLFCSLGGVLSDRYGIRQVAFAGGVLATAGTVSSAFVTSVAYLYITLGLLVGSGFALCLSQSLVILGHYFQRRLGLVYSLQACGGGAFAILFSLTLPALLGRAGLRYTFLCLAGLTALLVPSALTWTLPPGDERRGRSLGVNENRSRTTKLEPSTATPAAKEHGCDRKASPHISSVGSRTPRRDSIISIRHGFRRLSTAVTTLISTIALPSSVTFTKKSSASTTEKAKGRVLNVRIWKNPAYVIWTVSCMMGLFGLEVVPTHMVNFAHHTFPTCDSDLLPLGYGVAMATIRLLFGSVADWPGVKRVYVVLHQAAFLLVGLLTVTLADVGTFPVVVAYSVVLGLCGGVFFLLIGPIVVRLVGVRDSAQGLGFFLALVAVPIAAGPSVAGLLYDLHNKTYTVAFRVMGVPCLTASIILFFMPSPATQRSIQGQGHQDTGQGDPVHGGS